MRQTNSAFIRYVVRPHDEPVPARQASEARAYAAHLDPFDRTRVHAQFAPRTGGAECAFDEHGERREAAIGPRTFVNYESGRGSTVHLATRDDEGGDVGHLDYMSEYTGRADEASVPYKFDDDVRIDDPTSGSGEAQYHLIELDARMSVLNEERTRPLGYGTVEERRADSARMDARYSWRTPETGVIPKTSHKRLIRVQAPSGRVSMALDREYSRDIFSRDSRGYMLHKFA